MNITCDKENCVEVNGKKYYAAIEEEKLKLTGWEAPEKDQVYYYVSGRGIVEEIENDYPAVDNEIIRNCNAFLSAKFAKDIARAQKLQRALWKWQAENDVPVPGCPILRWIIWFDLRDNSIEPFSYDSHMVGGFAHFSTREKAKECIGTFYDELMWYFTEFSHRLDIWEDEANEQD